MERGGGFKKIGDITGHDSREHREDWDRNNRVTEIQNTGCQTCGGAGFLYPVRSNGKPDYLNVVPCSECQADALKAWQVRLSRLPKDDTARLETFEVRPGTAKAVHAARAMAARKAPHHMLTLVGTPGSGKTHLARSIGWAWIEGKLGSVLYYKAAEFLDDLRAGYDQKPAHAGTPSGFDRLMSRAEQVGLFILDDLGVQKSTEWAQERIDAIIDHRYEDRLATVVTTNLMAEQLGERVRDRLREGVTVQIEAGSYREVLAKRRGK